jgi:E3 ubiquitin-protein ligase RNF14
MEEEERICQLGVTSTSRNCAVCSETIPIHEFPALINCDHDPQVCAVCYKSWIASELDRKSWKEIGCPESGCKRLLKHAEVQQYATPEVYAK